MSPARIEECLLALRRADEMLIADRETLLAAHLSLVIELLAERLPNDKRG